jgi:hypothetical protein
MLCPFIAQHLASLDIHISHPLIENLATRRALGEIRGPRDDGKIVDWRKGEETVPPMAAHDLDLAETTLAAVLSNQELPPHFHTSGRFCNWSAGTEDRIEAMRLP